jgi:hypothetical protein
MLDAKDIQVGSAPAHAVYEKPKTKTTIKMLKIYPLALFEALNVITMNLL